MMRREQVYQRTSGRIPHHPRAVVSQLRALEHRTGRMVRSEGPMVDGVPTAIGLVAAATKAYGLDGPQLVGYVRHLLSTEWYNTRDYRGSVAPVSSFIKHGELERVASALQNHGVPRVFIIPTLIRAIISDREPHSRRLVDVKRLGPVLNILEMSGDAVRLPTRAVDGDAYYQWVAPEYRDSHGVFNQVRRNLTHRLLKRMVGLGKPVAVSDLCLPVNYHGQEFGTSRGVAGIGTVKDILRNLVDDLVVRYTPYTGVGRGTYELETETERLVAEFMRLEHLSEAYRLLLLGHYNSERNKAAERTYFQFSRAVRIRRLREEEKLSYGRLMKLFGMSKSGIIITLKNPVFHENLSDCKRQDMVRRLEREQPTDAAWIKQHLIKTSERDREWIRSSITINP